VKSQAAGARPIVASKPAHSFRSERHSVTCAVLALIALSPAIHAQIPETSRVLIVVNRQSSLSRNIGEYYARRRGVPARQICRIDVPPEEEIKRDEYDQDVARPIAACLKKNDLVESVYYIVTTAGVPLKIFGEIAMSGDASSVDSELTLLYTDIKTGKPHPVAGSIPNPFFGKKDVPFSHPQFPMYLVTRLAAYDFEGVKKIVDQALQAANRGKFVIDMNGPGNEEGNNWLRSAAQQLPPDRVVLDETYKVLYDQTDVIGYASWGSNDHARDRRFLGLHWLPGAIMTEYVSTNGRTFTRPPDNWIPGFNWGKRETWFAGAPQSLTADYILEGATGASGHTYEPYLAFTPRPDLLLPAYYNGRNLAQSYYLSIRALSWQNIVVGDPLCAIGKPGR